MSPQNLIALSSAILLGGALAGAVRAQLQDPGSKAAVIEQQHVDELTRELSSGDSVDRLQAVKALSAMARDAHDPARVRALLESARADADPNVSMQARVALARLDGVDVVPPEVRAAHRPAMARQRLSEARLALASHVMIERLRAVKELSAMATSRDAPDPGEIRALLEAATGDPDRNVATHAEAALARLQGIDPVAPETRRPHRLAMERQEVDECAALLSSPDMMERLGAVKTLSALAADALEPDRVRALLAGARTDPDVNVAEQARVALETRRARSGDSR